MIEEHIKQWHDFTHGNFPGGLDTLLADDIIFYSPVVFTPQEGKELAKLYLMAAGNTFGGDDAKKNGDIEYSSFRYTKEVLSGNQAILEFETKIEGKYCSAIVNNTADDCRFENLTTGARILVDRAMIEEVEYEGKKHHLILDNYVIAQIKE